MKAYAVVSQRGTIQIFTISELRKDAILKMETKQYKWNEIKKFGWKCVKIEIKVI